MARQLPQSFYARPALEVARDLLGKRLVRTGDDFQYTGTITETEAYVGPDDLACHAAKGRTKRTEVMFGKPGTWYVYLIYGMYDMLNVVTDKKEHPAAVLIRGVVTKEKDLDGPGKLTRDFHINRDYNGQKVSKQCGLWIEEANVLVHNRDVEHTPRIGVEYAGTWADKPYRFMWKKKGGTI